MSTYKYLHTNQKKIFTETNICKKKEMINILGSEIRLYFLDFPDNNIILTIYVPIKIDGVEVYVCISKNNEEKYTYMLETANIHIFSSTNNDQRSRIVVFISDNYFESFIELLDELNIIKDTYVFLNENIISPQKYELYLENPRICCSRLKKTEMCSVCFENTYIYTLCKHPLCFKCRDVWVQQKNVNCPVCRRKDVDIMHIEEDKEIIEAEIEYEYEDMEMLDLNTFLDNTLVEDTILYLGKRCNTRKSNQNNLFLSDFMEIEGEII